MKLHDAQIHFNAIANQPFKDLFPEDSLRNLRLDKGGAGKLLELYLGLANTNTNIDFEDGELKTNKVRANGTPAETVCITQILSHIDDLVTEKPFETTWLYEKIHNLLYVPACKEGRCRDWFFLPCVHVNLEDEKFYPIRAQLKKDYEFICAEIRKKCENKQSLSTISGKYMQIRTKNYGTIFSKIYQHQLTDNKNYAFYFTKAFIRDIKKI